MNTAARPTVLIVVLASLLALAGCGEKGAETPSELIATARISYDIEKTFQWNATTRSYRITEDRGTATKTILYNDKQISSEPIPHMFPREGSDDFEEVRLLFAAGGVPQIQYFQQSINGRRVIRGAPNVEASQWNAAMAGQIDVTYADDELDSIAQAFIDEHESAARAWLLEEARKFAKEQGLSDADIANAQTQFSIEAATKSNLRVAGAARNEVVLSSEGPIVIEIKYIMKP